MDSMTKVAVPDTWPELLCQLSGIYAANVVFSKDDRPEEIHVLASQEKSPKTLTRDIQSAAMAAFGVAVDYRIISIAQITWVDKNALSN